MPCLESAYVHLVVLEAALVGGAVGELERPVAFLFALPELALEHHAVGELFHAAAIFQVVDVRPRVPRNTRLLRLVPVDDHALAADLQELVLAVLAGYHRFLFQQRGLALAETLAALEVPLVTG